MAYNTLKGASLDDPLYYLENGRRLIHWVLDRHGDLLLSDETARLRAFLALDVSPQALLLRLVMRTHDHFRVDSLDYPELPQPLPHALGILLQKGWLQPDPPLTLAQLTRLLRRQEWHQLLVARGLADSLPASTGKARMVAHLQARDDAGERPLSSWWPNCPHQVVKVADAALFRRLRLLCFGNLYQDWSQLVITELGHQRYARVPLEGSTSAFRSRAEVDLYMVLHDCRQALAEGDITPPEAWQVLSACSHLDNAWLIEQHARLAHELGRKAERNEDIDLALQAYRCAWQRDSRIRYFRVAERHQAVNEVWPCLTRALEQAVSMEEIVCLQRIQNRLARRLGRPRPTPALPSPPSQRVRLPQPPDTGVELAVAAALTDADHSCHYVENRLFTGLLGLLCWQALYAPIPGAFFHPFQAGPADLFREDFAHRRRDQLAALLGQLDDGRYRATIVTNWRQHWGTACPLIRWNSLEETLLQHALSCIPAANLKAILSHLLQDLQHHRRGLPDLIRFDHRTRDFELIEVKGPGDRLQDPQRQWLGFFARQGIAARVCHVDWARVG